MNLAPIQPLHLRAPQPRKRADGEERHQFGPGVGEEVRDFLRRENLDVARLLLKLRHHRNPVMVFRQPVALLAVFEERPDGLPRVVLAPSGNLHVAEEVRELARRHRPQLAVKRVGHLPEVEAQHLHVNLARALALLRFQHFLHGVGHHLVGQRVQMPPRELLRRLDHRRLSAEHLPRFRVFRRRQFQRQPRRPHRLDRVNVGDALRVPQVQHILFALRQRNRLRLRIRVRLVEVGEHLQLPFAVREIRNRETIAPLVLDLVDFDDDGARLNLHRKHHSFL